MRNTRAFIIGIFILLIYQNFKYIARNFYPQFTTTNTGAAFGILQGQNLPLLIVAIIVLSIITFVLLKKKLNTLQEYGLGLLLGGVLGNVIDRLFFSHVFDFISLPFWPSFNIADAANTIGVLLLLIAEYQREHAAKTHAS